MKAIFAALAVTLAVPALASAASSAAHAKASPHIDGKRCIVTTEYTGLTMKSTFLRSLGLTPEQVKEVRSIFAGLSTDGVHIYGGLLPGELNTTRRTFEQVYAARLAGLGLTPEQKTGLAANVAAQIAAIKPTGSPCAPFVNPKLVVQRLRSGLSGVTNLAFRVKPRIIFLSGEMKLSAGQSYSVIGQAVKTQRRQIMVRLQVLAPTVWTDSLGTHSRF